MTVPPRTLVLQQRATLAAIQARQRTSICRAFAVAHTQIQPAIETFCTAYAQELNRVRTVQPESPGSDPSAEPDPDAKVSLVWLHASPHLHLLKGVVDDAMAQAATDSKAAMALARKQAAIAGRNNTVTLIKAAAGKGAKK